VSSALHVPRQVWTTWHVMQQTKRGRAMKSALLFIQVLCFRLHQIELALPGARTVRRKTRALTFACRLLYRPPSRLPTCCL